MQCKATKDRRTARQAHRPIAHMLRQPVTPFTQRRPIVLIKVPNAVLVHDFPGSALRYSVGENAARRMGAVVDASTG
jgi:hypothetical protein